MNLGIFKKEIGILLVTMLSLALLFSALMTIIALFSFTKLDCNGDGLCENTNSPSSFAHFVFLGTLWFTFTHAPYLVILLGASVAAYTILRIARRMILRRKQLK